MPGQPGANLWLLMGCVVIENDVNGLILREFGLNRVEEAAELLMPVALHVAAAALTNFNLQRGVRP